MSHDNGNAGEEGSSNGASGTDRIRYVSISQETRRRYLNYALSVITSRALPDVRDGLKPVQRRILYVMFEELHLHADAKTRKCAKISGDTTGNYHPHGTVAVYDALVRMAQDFSLRYPLVFGQGNFGSILGLPAASERYTEAKLTSIAAELLKELRFQTVDMRPNYDATREEPVVLPARFPNLLVNGTQGIAVGMATSIPPHNLTEVVNACIELIRAPESTVAQLMKFIKGPDFPYGGRVVTDRISLRQMYESGRGAIKLRAEWKLDRTRQGVDPTRIVIHSVPYGIETGPLLTDIGQIVASRKLPQLLEVTDETSDKLGLRIVLETKPDSDPDAVMAYLYKHTNLEHNISYNCTCLVPDEQGTLVPANLSVAAVLRHFLEFRFTTVRRRFEFQLRQLERRIHILEGFAIVFDGLDKALAIIRKSDGREDAAEKLMKEFPLDREQVMAVLDLALYRISQLEIGRIVQELNEARAEAEKIRRILASKKRLWSVVQTELNELVAEFGDKRRTSLGSSEEIAEFDPQAYIVRENTNVVVTQGGWLKRVGRIQSVATTRVREGDAVLAVVPASTLDSVVIFGNDGVAYTLPIDAVPASSGYGDPLSKLVRCGDGVSIVAAMTTDLRFVPEDRTVSRQPTPAPYLVIATRNGLVMRYSFSPFRSPSTKVGRKYCRLATGDRVVSVEMVREDQKTLFLATKRARIIHFKIKETPVLAGAGKGVRGIKLEEKDQVLGAVLLARASDCLRVLSSNGKVLSFGQTKYGITSRGGKGVKTSQRNEFDALVRPDIALVDWAEVDQE